MRQHINLTQIPLFLTHPNMHYGALVLIRKVSLNMATKPKQLSCAPRCVDSQAHCCSFCCLHSTLGPLGINILTMKILQTLCLLLLFITFSLASHRRISNRVNQFVDTNNYVRPNRARDIASSVDRAVGCKAAPTSWMYQFLNRICEDCFQLYRNTDLYHMCR